MRRLQSEDQVPRSLADGEGPWRRGPCHRPLCQEQAWPGRLRALPGRDAERDQSYFLFATTREQLDFLRFPLGDLDKDTTRKLAREFGLPTAEKSDSQDICFVPTGRYTKIIERLRPGAAEPGDIVHVDGRVLGRHSGIINYTIGQRRGIGVAAAEPLYVVRLDAERREVVVGPREGLRTRHIELRDVNWLGDEPLEDVPGHGKDVLARIRSSGPLQPATLRVEPRGSGSILPRARMACRLDRLACFTRPRSGESGFWAAAGSGRPRRRRCAMVIAHATPPRGQSRWWRVRVELAGADASRERSWVAPFGREVERSVVGYES